MSSGSDVGLADVSESPPAERSPPSAPRRRASTLWSLAGYALLSMILFGLPVVGHLGSRIVASDALDSSQFMWFFGWWPHALLHGLNPFVTHAMFVPDGFNLTWSTAMPGPSIILAPITLAFSPVVTWNVIQLASPALGAWTMYLLCREITGRTGPSLAAGYVFGFSPYMLVHLTGGPYLALVALLPVLIRLILRRLHGTLGPRRFVIYSALALTAEFLTSSEVLATATIFGGVAYLTALALYPAQRRALLATAAELAGAYVVMVILISPFLYYFFFGHQYPPGATYFPADVVSFGLPPSMVALGRHFPPFGGSNNESYLGLPLIMLILAWIWIERRQRRTWLIAIPMVAALVCSLGGDLMVRGKYTAIPGIWKWLAHLPILKYAIPVRLSLFVIIPAAVIVALFLSGSESRSGSGLLSGPGSGSGSGVGTIGRWRWALAALAIAFIVPDVGSSNWNTLVRDPAFFSNGQYRHYLHASDNVLTVPAWGPNERWQADTGFRFQLAAGYAGNPFPPSYARFPTWQTLLTGVLTRDYAAQLRRFVRAKRVTAVVIDEAEGGPWKQLFGTLGVRPISTGGVLLYRLKH